MAARTPFIMPTIGKKLNLALFDLENMTAGEIKVMAEAIRSDASLAKPMLEEITTGPNAEGRSLTVEIGVGGAGAFGGYLGFEDACRCGGTCFDCCRPDITEKFTPLFEAIANHPTIRMLDLGFLSPQAPIDMTPIIRMIAKNNPLLHTVVLWHNALEGGYTSGSKAKNLLKDAIANNRTLKRLNTGCNSVWGTEFESETSTGYGYPKTDNWIVIFTCHPTLEKLIVSKQTGFNSFYVENTQKFLGILNKNQHILLELADTPNQEGIYAEEDAHTREYLAKIKPMIDALNNRNRDLKKTQQAFEMEHVLSSVQDKVYEGRKKMVLSGGKEEVVNEGPDFDAKAFMEVFSYLDDKPLKDKLSDYNSVGLLSDIKQFKEFNSMICKLGTLAKAESAMPALFLKQYKGKRSGKESLIHSRTMTKEEMEFLIGFMPESISETAILTMLSCKDLPVVSAVRQTSSSSREAASSAGIGWIFEGTEEQIHKIQSILHSRGPKPTVTASSVTVTASTVTSGAGAALPASGSVTASKASGAGAALPVGDGPATGATAVEASTSDPEKEKMIRELEKRKLELMAKISSVRSGLSL